MTQRRDESCDLPVCVVQYVDAVVGKMRGRRRVRREVQRELTDHFVDALRECSSDADRHSRAEHVIEGFGDPRVLARLIRRGKKRCRPTWFKAIIRTAQIVGVLILLIAARIGYLASGSPTISVDYVEWLNNHVRDGHDESLNAEPLLDQAVQLATEYQQATSFDSSSYTGLWPGDMTAQWRSEVEVILRDNAQAIALARKAAEKPYYWPTYAARAEALTNKTSVPIASLDTGDSLKHLGGYRHLAKLLKMQIYWDVYEGRSDEAMRDCMVMRKLGTCCQARGMLVEQLSGMAIEGLSLHTMVEVVALGSPTTDMLHLTQQQLEAEVGTPVFDFEGERSVYYDCLQQAFTDDGRGGGRLVIHGMPFGAADGPDMLRRFALCDFPDRREAMAMVESFFREARSLCDMTPWELHSGDADSQNRLKANSLFLNLLGPVIEKVASSEGQFRGERAAVITVLGLERWRRSEGDYPVSLDELVSGGYLKALPDDPFSGGVLRYERRDESYILYSVGRGFVDDGGVIRAGDSFGEDGGDWVFWPVQRRGCGSVQR